MPIHPTAIVDSAAEIHPSAEIGPYVVIDGAVRIGEETRVAAFVHLMGPTEIGTHCRIHSGAMIGDVPQDRAFKGGDSFCRIGDRTIIREGVTIHRGTAAGSATTIGAGCFLMCNSHVGHNCKLADGVTLVNGALLGGYVEIGAFAIISGNVGVHQQVRIGELCIIGGLAKVVQDVPPYMTYAHDRGCVGINLIGMRRNGGTAAERADARKAYKTLYRSGLGLQEAIQILAETVQTRTGRAILDFVTAPSQRGLVFASDDLDSDLETE